MRRALSALVVLCWLATLAACSGPSGKALAGLTFRVALGRIAVNDRTRESVTFDDTARLVALSGKDLSAPPSGFGSLRARGVSGLAPFVQTIADRPGITLFDATYTIAAGRMPRQVNVIAGGQNTNRIMRGLTELGWHADGNQLTAPDYGTYSGPEDLAVQVLTLAKVRGDGSDLVYGGPAAELGDAGKPSGHTLADDPRIGALADCLGDVVAASIATPAMTGQLHPTAVAIGVRAPSHDTDTPHAVACLSWASADEAGRYTTLLTKVLGQGESARQNRPWKDLLHNATTREIGGGEHIVAWEADTPGNAALAFALLDSLDLPAFPCSDRMSPQARAQLADYC